MNNLLNISSVEPVREQKPSALPQRSPRHSLKQEHGHKAIVQNVPKVSPKPKRPCFIPTVTTRSSAKSGHQASTTVSEQRKQPSKTPALPPKSSVPQSQQIGVIVVLASQTSSPSTTSTTTSQSSILRLIMTSPLQENISTLSSTPSPQPQPINLPKLEDFPDMSSFLVEFQTKMNDGINYLKTKISDPIDGLEHRVGEIETTINADKSGLKDRVMQLETSITDPVSGFKPRIELLEKSVVSGIVDTAGGAAVDNTTLQQLRTQVNTLEKCLNTTQFESKVLLSWADTMFKDHKSLQRQVFFNTFRSHSQEVIVGGIYEHKKQDCRQAAMKFFRDKLDVVVLDSDVLKAYRVSGRKVIQIEEISQEGEIRLRKVTCPRHMVVKCAPHFKNLIMEKKLTLGGKVDQAGYKYFIANYLPEPFKAAKDKHREEVLRTIEENKSKKPEDRKSVRVVGPDLFIGGKIQRGFIHPPSPGEVCSAKEKFAAELNSYDFFKTQPLPYSGSTFQGFAVFTTTLQGVYLSYCKVRMEFPQARHIMCAYNVADIHDSCDDGEDHGGLLLARLLKNAGKINNDIAIFVARETGPDQLGAKRFSIIRTIAQELFQILNTAARQPIYQHWPARVPSPTQNFNVEQRLSNTARAVPATTTPEGSDNEQEQDQEANMEI